MKIIKGTNRYTASRLGGVYRPALTELDLMTDDVREDVMSTNGFVEKALGSFNVLEDFIDLGDDMSIQTIDKLFMLREPEDIAYVVGKQADYLFSHPLLKEFILSDELDINHDFLGREEIGLFDPIFRDIHSNVVKKSGDDYRAVQYPLDNETGLSKKEKVIAVLNHRFIDENMDSLLDMIPSKPKKVDDDGTESF